MDLELLQISGRGLYAYSPASDSWGFKGNTNVFTTKQTPVIRNSDNQFHPTAAYNRGLKVRGWEDDDGARISVYSNDAQIQANVLLEAGAKAPQAIATDDFIFVFFVVSGALKI